jgi:hypothetical protein
MHKRVGTIGVHNDFHRHEAAIRSHEKRVCLLAQTDHLYFTVEPANFYKLNALQILEQEQLDFSSFPAVCEQNGG